MQQMKGWKFILALVAIFLISINLRPSITSVGPLLNTIGEDLQISNTKMSLLTSIPVFCMGLFAPLAVQFQKRMGYRMAIFFFVTLIGIATFARLFFTSYASLLVTCFVLGFAIAIISPMINAFIKEKFPEQLALVIGLYSLAIGAGATISAGFSGIFYERFNSWSFALGIWGVLAIVAMIIWLIAIDKDKTVNDVTVTDEAARNPWKTKTAWLLLFYFGLQTSLFFSLTTWLSPIAMDEGFSLLTAGSILTTMSIVQLVSNIFISMLIQRYPNRIAWLYGLLAIGALGVALLFFEAAWATWTGAIILGITLSGLFPIGLILPLDEAKNKREANEWSAMVLSGGFMMGAITPLLIGIVYDMTGTHFYTKVIYALLFIALFISVYLIQRNRK
ncbi:MFS transporter [Solibacillus sp. CAU 1738]|uniref:MFS transporter n=1 Tax=Solibacillus sp. CAU 1738 TaxID=3140363 RepID=UPI00325FFA86